MSRRCGIGLMVLILAANGYGQDSEQELKRLEGTWIPSKAELSGTPFPEAIVKTMKLELTGEKYTVTVGKDIDRGTIKVDASKTPKAMDILGGEGPNKGKTFLAIYELDGDTLRICYDLNGKARPTEFKTAKGAFTFLVTYQRQKP